MGQSPIQTVPACPIQIRAHHHIDVYIDINEQLRLLILVEPKQMSTGEDRLTMAHIAWQLHSVCSRESGLHLNVLASPHPVGFKEKILP